MEEEEKMKTEGSEVVNFTVKFNKTVHEISWESCRPISSLKEHIQKLTDVPISMQKLMYKGILKNDQTLSGAKITNGAKIMLIGSKLQDVISANQKVKPEVGGKSSSSKKKEPLSEQKIHKKVIDQGPPDEAMPAYKNGHESLPDIPLFGMQNKSGNKVRLTFKLESDEVWISTKERTEKIPMNSIRSVISEAIKGKEEYHIMGFGLGTTENSRYWLYWVPAQYVRAIKNTIMGV